MKGGAAAKSLSYSAGCNIWRGRRRRRKKTYFTAALLCVSSWMLESKLPTLLLNKNVLSFNRTGKEEVYVPRQITDNFRLLISPTPPFPLPPQQQP